MHCNSAVIVVNWNSWVYLERCLDALINQTVRFQQIIVIDNNSIEDAPDSIRLLVHLNSIRLIQLPANVGFAKANNIAIDMAAGCDWVALVNPDAFLENQWHEKMQNCIEQFPSAASFASVLLKANEHTKWDGLGDIYHISGLAWRDAHGITVGCRQLSRIRIFSPCAAAAFYRRQTLIDVGCFDEDFFCYMEDVDLGYRLNLLGYSAVLVPEAIAYHIGSATTGSQHSQFAVYHGHRNLVWTFVKDMPGVLLWLLLPIHLAMNAVTIVWFSLQGYGGVILRAKRDAVLGLPAIWRKRKLVQRSRRCSIREIWRILDKRLFIRK